jgi:D-sedoheptulose 7-phosphate isomerase
MTFPTRYLAETVEILNSLNVADIDHIAGELSRIRLNGGRLFILGVGGSAATASHAVNDFRKLCKIETYAPTDNVAELTARINDDGWETSFVEWLRVSNIGHNDALMVLSVGGGTRRLSENIVAGVNYARSYNATVLGIVGRDGGHTAQRANVCVIVPPLYADHITPHTEGIASVILHLLVSHPSLTT